MAKLIVECLAYEKGKAYGYQQYLENLLNYFYLNVDKLNFSSIIIYCIDCQKSYFEKYGDKMIIYGCKVNNIISRLFVQSMISWKLNLNREDVVLFTGNYSSLIKRSRHVLVVHDLLFKRKKWIRNVRMRLQRTLYMPLSIKYADKIIAISNFTAKDIVSYYPESRSKINVIYNCFNFRKFGNFDANICKQNYFLSVCSSAFHKNTITLFDAFEEYIERGGKWNLVLVGRVKGIPYLENRYNKLSKLVKDRIEFCDNISNVELALLYQQSNAYISCSLFEGLGMPIVEAMYFKLPLILTNDDVFREISQDKGRYINPLDKNDIAQKMIMMETDSFKMQYDLYPFTEESTSEKYVELLNRFVDKL